MGMYRYLRDKACLKMGLDILNKGKGMLEKITYAKKLTKMI